MQKELAMLVYNKIRAEASKSMAKAWVEAFIKSLKDLVSIREPTTT